MKLLFDWSVLCHTCWHVMKSPNYEAKTDIEQVEFARNLAGAVLYYTYRFQPQETIFALDAKGGYWRHKVMDKYYRKNCVVTTYIEPLNEDSGKDMLTPRQFYILSYDKRVYSLQFIEGPNKWVSKKLTKAERAELEKIKQTKVPYKKVPEEIKKFFPSYKKGRKDAAWDYETTREEWQQLCNKIVKNLAVTCGAKVIEVAQAEADDVAKVYADMNSAHDMIFITTDSDWSQLLADHMFLKLFNPTKRDWNMVTPGEANFDLAVKIISGDSADKIPAISLVNAAATLGPKKAKELALEHGYPEIYNYLETEAELGPLYRNYELIFLDNIPENLQNKIQTKFLETKIQTSKKPYRYSHYGISSAELAALKSEAEQDRLLDAAEGEGG